MNCKNCNHKLEPGDLFCGECGTKVESNVEAVSPRVNIVNNTDEVQQQTTQNDKAQQAIINKELVNQQSKELVNEGKGFFATAFKNHDLAFTNGVHFSIKLTGALIGIGLLIIALLLMIKIPSEIAMFGISKSSIIFKCILSALVFIALIIGATFTISKLMINPALKFTKVVSDFVLINVFSFIFILVGFLLIMINTLSFGTGVLVLGIMLLAISPIYLIGKYSQLTQPKIASFYGVIIYMIILAIVLRIFGESMIGMLQGVFTQSVNSAVNGLFNN
ncbi:zinc ribbon domain-containing protein [Macrococcus capreoli]|uniref:zinc ribbon domain-containing protein n=1 Tax=Macrococcus capreoli TaxID=2982690 RepID=UPI0021D5B476|nr:zinc ribbon domain-containing protein [Macrococcus sp. TMW 2.2395]MCU7556146.1 zinc ribbon domain-containing protein [Macrococcus sp. TMW 2.2395]